ncbi:hypothetical protein FKW77_009585 [Venturia effusa]|uniref:HTH CENPB-type domain-containing protein n=1 Tax=Venturia effusa TaxID=50376 RepID=A0A517LEM0_9PEZI|nr:hypothetical protein FKW77_009585 [Venturia effusa]
MVRFHMSKSTVAEPQQSRDVGYGSWSGGQSTGNGPHWGNDHIGYQSHNPSSIHDHNAFVYTPLQDPPPMYAASSMPPPRTTYPQLQPHITSSQLPMGYPSEYRPSQLRSQSMDQNQFSPPYSMNGHIASAPLPTVPAPLPRGSGRSGSNPRKTLTDADRRNMCIYAEKHPAVKQQDIGALFGVERSTVSKVLRQKDKYMQQDDGSRSPARKPKNKGQDPERTLVNWVKKHHKRGDAITDEMLKKKLIYFASAAQNSDAHTKANNPAWVKKFKREHNLHGLKSRKNSIADESEELSAPPSGAQTPNSHSSPCSPPPGDTKEESPSAMSIIKDEDDMESESPNFESEFSFGHKPYHSMSNASLASMFDERGPFSPGPGSPGSGLFGQDPSSPFNQDKGLSSAPGNPSRPRSQTFPIADTTSYISPANSEPLTPKYLTGTALDHSPLGNVSSALSSVEELSEPDMNHRPTSMVSSSPHGLALGGISNMPPHLSMNHSGHHHSGTPTPVSGIQSAGAYSLEHAFDILRIAMMEQGNGAFDPQDYMTLGKIMNQLNVQTNQLGGDIGFHRVGSADFHQYMKSE